MKDIHLINYSVRGIKSLDRLVSLSFYKKTISKEFDTQRYNMKGIYGMNGSGKTGIITSIDIFRNILTDSEYLNNPIVQKSLDAIINKKTRELFVEADYVVEVDDDLDLFRYSMTISKNNTGKYILFHEELAYRRATSKNDRFTTIYEAKEGKLVSVLQKEKNIDFANMIISETMNLLSSSSLSALFFDKLSGDSDKYRELYPDKYDNVLLYGLIMLVLFGKRIHVCLDQLDDHSEYFIRNSFWDSSELKKKDEIDSLIENYIKLDTDIPNVISIYRNAVHKDSYDHFKAAIDNLYEFLHIFKSDLKDIEIDKKEDGDIFFCNLIMEYDSYRVHTEFESTGIKKLIRLYAYLKEMARGGIVFIDEFDSNLHDVYLCALLEYLMEYGEGQLCFTTHNVGLMDILKRNKKSIDFLSIDNNIYPWKTNGNYSPSKLYKNGMIEGSPFNVDSIDFISAFQFG